jgi:COMPASS component SWD1
VISLLFVVALFEDQPRLVDLTSEIPVKRTLPSIPKRAAADIENEGEKQAAQHAKNTTTVAAFTKSGDHILTGTNKGWINVIDATTCEVVASTHLANALIINLRVGSGGRDALVNSSDRCVRTINLPDLSAPDFNWETLDLTVEHKFQDQINRQQWNHACFSSNGEYAAMTSYMNHIIYLWERTEKGSLVAVLEGPKEELSAVEWHPNRALVASIGVDTGRIYLWGVPTPQRWSALAPDFVEVEENVEYIEREDEFDIQPIEEVHKRRLDREDEDLDVLSLEPGEDQDGDIGAFRMPVLLDIDASDSDDEVIAIGAGQFRRKSPGAGRDWPDEGSAAPSGDEFVAARGSDGTKRRRAD